MSICISIPVCHTATKYFQDSCKLELNPPLPPPPPPILGENQPREQAGFWIGYSTSDHLQGLNQIIEKSNEYSLPLRIGFINYKKAFDIAEHFAISETLRKLTKMKHLLKSYKISPAKLQQGSI